MSVIGLGPTSGLDSATSTILLNSMNSWEDSARGRRCDEGVFRHAGTAGSTTCRCGRPRDQQHAPVPRQPRCTVLEHVAQSAGPLPYWARTPSTLAFGSRVTITNHRGHSQFLVETWDKLDVVGVQVLRAFQFLVNGAQRPSRGSGDATAGLVLPQHRRAASARSAAAPGPACRSCTRPLGPRYLSSGATSVSLPCSIEPYWPAVALGSA